MQSMLNLHNQKITAVIIVLMILVVNFILVLPKSGNLNISNQSFLGEDSLDVTTKSITPIPSDGLTRGVRSIGFTDNSTGLPSTGGYNFVAFGDINNDGQIDIGTGGEDRGSLTTQGLYVYTGNGGTSWSGASTGLWTGNSWGGVQLADADGDGYIELYGTDEHWGTFNNSGLKVFEYRSSVWTDSITHVSTPLPTGIPDNVIIENITGDNKLDMVVSNSTSGLAYFENTGGNPVIWVNKAMGLGTSNEYTTFAVADMNKDGLKDIVACDYAGGEHLFIQQTSGNQWAEHSTGISIGGNQLGVALGDVNSDTHMDILYGGQGGGLKCLLGNSGGGSGGTSFSWTAANTGLSASGQYWQIAVADLDLDGDLDLIGPRSPNDNQGIEVYVGNGSTAPGLNLGWTKASNTNLPTTGSYSSVNCYDINNDGSSDIAATSWGSGLRCFINNLSGNFDLTPPGAVNDLNSTNVTTNSITVNWTAPADNGSIIVSGPVQSYDIRYSTSNINPGNWASAIECIGEPTPAAPGTPQGYQVTGLSPGTQYYIALRSVDERPNLSPLSNIVINTTLGILDTTLPGQISDLQTVNPTNNSINLTWTAPADNGSIISSGLVIGYDIRYNISASITNTSWDSSTEIAVSLIPSTPGLMENYNVTGLQADNTYYFAIKAHDERPNWGWISNSPSGKTLLDPDLAPPALVNDLKAIEPTDTTINLSWTAPGDDGNTGTASQYDIRYATTSITDLTWATATQCLSEPTPQSTGNNEYYIVTDLNPDTTYYFAIKTADEIPLWSGLSNIASNKTIASLDTIPPAAITDLTTSQPTPTNITLRWSAPGDDGNTGTCSGYDIRYNTDPITESLWAISTQCQNSPTPLPAGNQQTYVVSGLLSAQKYYFAVKAFDERPNYSPLSNIADGTTLSSNDEIAPGTVTDLSAGTLSSNSIELTWTAPGDDSGSGIVTGYDIRYSTSSITESTWDAANKCDNEPTPQIAGSSESYTVNGLFAGTTYYFALKSFDERPNYSLLSNIASAATYSSDDTIPPDQITDLAVVETTETTVTLTWTAPGDDGNSGTATAYDIRYAEVSITTTNWDSAIKVLEAPIPKSAGQNEIFLVTGLDESVTYYFGIKVADEVPNWAPISNSPFGTTKGTAKPELEVTFTPDEITVESGGSIDLGITVKSKIQQQTISDASIEVSSNNPVFIFNPTNGQTDQNGALIVRITAPTVGSLTQFILNVKVLKLGFKTNRSQLIITVQPQGIPPLEQFNLHISNDELTLSQSTIKEGDIISIYANILNNGDRDATVFIVRFYINNQQHGFDLQIPNLKINEYYRAELLWTAVEGNHNISVEITANEQDLESDLTDNSAKISITVLDKDGDKEDKGDDKAMGIEDYIWVLIIVIIIVIVLVLFIVLKKRKQPPKDFRVPSDERVTDQPQEPEPTEGVEPEQPEEPGISPAEEVIESEGEIPAEEPVVTPPETGLAPIPEPEQPPLAQPIQTPPQEPVQEVPTQEPPAQEPIQEPVQEPAVEEQPVQEQTVVEIQQFPCPICQNIIPMNTTPCPQCGTELNW